MIDSKLEMLLNELIDENYHTASAIADKIESSVKTVRIRIKDLNEILKFHGAEIESKPKWGYKITIKEKSIFKAFYKRLNDENKQKLPTTSAERVAYILAFLLNREGYIKLEDFCNFLYVSRNTLTIDLKKVEYILNIYHLELERRPNYGILVRGEEFDRRICIANNLVKRNSFMKNDIRRHQELQSIGDEVLEVIHSNKMSISEVSLESLIIHTYVAVRRIRHNNKVHLDSDKIRQLVGIEAIQATTELAKQLEDKLHLTFPEEEIHYLALHMGAKLSSNSLKKYGANIVISGEIDELVLRMLNAVYNGFKIDFRNNLDLRMSLNQHMIPFDIRMQYGIPMKNPIISEIKKEYAFAYMVAATACTVLNEHYKMDIPEDELGYFAMLFALALEKQERKIEKKNIVVVCMSGKGSSQLFIYKYKQAFGKYINNIYECQAFDLENFNFWEKKIDYVFTTIPINVKVPVPVFEVNLFLELKDIVAYSELFEMGNNELLYKYYKKKLFLPVIKGESKGEIIRTLCNHAGMHYNLPKNFYEAVIRREELGQTDFGNMAAIPHPYKVITKENFVIVGILEKPILWGHNEVQVVFLMAISTEEDADVERFYRLTTNLLFDASKIQYLIHNPVFEVLISLLTDNTYTDKI